MTAHVGDELDTALARRLHARGEMDQPTLKRCLDEVRGRRVEGEEASLALLLLQRRLVEPQAIDAATQELDMAATLSGEGEEQEEFGGMPRKLGPYKLVGALARGGMGAVYEVVHERTGEHFALKTLLPAGMGAGVLDPESIGRLRREARVLLGLDHPNIVRVHKAKVEEHPHFLVMDLLRGGSLRDRIKADGPLDVDEAVRVTIDLSRALQYAHDEGILHRDLKPGNVLFDEQRKPYVVDFGLARVVDASLRLTATGQILGTPAYMPPEQALSDVDIDQRADVYGMGALLYAMLTGKNPFKGQGLFAVLEAVLYEAPKPPREIREGIPEAVEAVCLRAMSKLPDERYSTTEELAGALEAAWSGERPPLPLKRGKRPREAASTRPPQRQRALIVGLIGSGVLVGGLIGLVFRGDPSAPSDAPPTLDRKVAASEDQKGGPPGQYEQASVEPAVERESHELRWRLEKHQVLRYRLSFQEGFLEEPPKTKIRLDTRQVVTSASSDRYVFEASIERAVVQPRPGEVFDSDEEAGKAMIGPFMKEPFEIALDPLTGGCTVSGLPEVPGNFLPMLGGMAPDRLLTLGFARLCSLLPGRRMAVSESWTIPDARTSVMMLDGRGLKVCTLEGVSGGLATISTRLENVIWALRPGLSVLETDTRGSLAWKNGRLVEAQEVDKLTLRGSEGNTVQIHGVLRYELIQGRE